MGEGSRVWHQDIWAEVHTDYTGVWNGRIINRKKDTSYEPCVSNVRPAGQIWPITSLYVAQESFTCISVLRSIPMFTGQVVRVKLSMCVTYA